MGGNALKEYTSRKKRDEYQVIVDSVLQVLRDDHRAHAEELPYYRTKETFGDADILVDNTGLDTSPVTHLGKRMPQWFASVLKDFDSNHFYLNSPVYGFAYQDLQIDLITCNPDEFDSSLNYYAWNDLGNLMGRIAHKMGFKYGHRGLEHVMRHDDSHAYGSVLITNNVDEILSFLGYEPRVFHDGFDTLEQVWQYASSSRYFNPAIYQLDNLNSKSKVRDKKRTTYMGFLKWLERGAAMRHYQWGEREPRRAKWLAEALGAFPEFAARYVEAARAESEYRAGHDKWNGDLVGEWTGSKWKVLGSFMAFVRRMAPWAHPTLLHRYGADELKSWTMEFWTLYQETDEYKTLIAQQR